MPVSELDELLKADSPLFGWWCLRDPLADVTGHF